VTVLHLSGHLYGCRINSHCEEQNWRKSFLGQELPAGVTVFSSKIKDQSLGCTGTGGRPHNVGTGPTYSFNFCIFACLLACLEMGPLALAGEPVWLRHGVRDDWSRRLAVPERTQASG